MTFLRKIYLFRLNKLISSPLSLREKLRLFIVLHAGNFPIYFSCSPLPSCSLKQLTIFCLLSGMPTKPLFLFHF